MSDKQFLYEVLVRGTPDGQIAGAHQVWARAFTDDATGELITIKHGFAEVLKVEDVKALISANFVGAAQQIADLSAELEAEKGRADRANMEAMTSKRQADELSVKLR